MFELFLVLIAGIFAGVIMGLIPGLHPNTIVLAVPLLLSLQLSPLVIIVFLVTMGIVNVFIDFIPSLLLGAPDGDSALSALPGHRLLIAGRGYEAIRCSVIGGLGGILFCLCLLPFLVLIVPAMWSAARPLVWIFLIIFAAIMISTEKNWRSRFLAAIVFCLAGLFGVLVFQLPFNSLQILFPILAGFFGIPLIVLQLKNRNALPPQSFGHDVIPNSLRSIGTGTACGIAAGLLPGVGSSELAAIVSTDRNDRRFLTTLGALVAANSLLSFLALWLIGNPRSGVALALDQLVSIGPMEFVAIIATAMIATGVAAILTLIIARKMLNKIFKINYTKLNLFVLILILALIIIFTGIPGLILAGFCTAFGLLVNLLRIKRGLLMAVLIVPTIAFYAGI
jgi:putative membrane protein